MARLRFVQDAHLEAKKTEHNHARADVVPPLHQMLTSQFLKFSMDSKHGTDQRKYLRRKHVSKRNCRGT